LIPFSKAFLQSLLIFFSFELIFFSFDQFFPINYLIFNAINPNSLHLLLSNIFLFLDNHGQQFRLAKKQRAYWYFKFAKEALYPLKAGSAP
jgi:hypothetical protein